SVPLDFCSLLYVNEIIAIHFLSLHDALPISMRGLEGKALHGRSVAVARLGALTAIRDCDLLYVGKDEARSLPRIAELLGDAPVRSEEHTSELQSRENLVCRLLLEKKKQTSYK